MTGHSGALSYYACLGVGLVFVEIVLIQRFVLFLSHPAYAISGILFSLLFLEGLGSFLSGCFGLQRRSIHHKRVCGESSCVRSKRMRTFPSGSGQTT